MGELIALEEILEDCAGVGPIWHRICHRYGRLQGGTFGRFDVIIFLFRILPMQGIGVDQRPRCGTKHRCVGCRLGISAIFLQQLSESIGTGGRTSCEYQSGLFERGRLTLGGRNRTERRTRLCVVVLLHIEQDQLLLQLA